VSISYYTRTKADDPFSVIPGRSSIPRPSRHLVGLREGIFVILVSLIEIGFHCFLSKPPGVGQFNTPGSKKKVV
jgi:hypothetical protein